MSLSSRIATVLAPHLGAQSADVVSRHICAKFGVDETATEPQMEQLTEFLHRLGRAEPAPVHGDVAAGMPVRRADHEAAQREGEGPRGPVREARRPLSL